MGPSDSAAQGDHADHGLDISTPLSYPAREDDELVIGKHIIKNFIARLKPSYSLAPIVASSNEREVLSTDNDGLF
jgi:hypothetical protein